MCFLWVFPPFWYPLKGDVPFCRPVIGLKEPSPLVHDCNCSPITLSLVELPTEGKSCPSWRAGLQSWRWPSLGSGLGATEHGTPRKRANLWLDFSCKTRRNQGVSGLLFTWAPLFCWILLIENNFIIVVVITITFFKKQKPAAPLLPLPFRCDFSSPLYDTKESNRDIVALSPLSALLPQAVSLN